MDLRFGFYRRKSTDSRGKQQYSLETQDTWKTKTVEDNNYTVIEEYTESETATKVVGRVEFYRMIEDIHTGKINAILVYEIDRLARNFTENSIIQTLSQEGKIQVIHTGTGVFYPDDILHLGMKTLFSVYESHQMKKKMVDGTNSTLARGHYMGSIHYGYKSVNKRLVIDETEAFHIRTIFELREEGMTMSDIAKQVNLLGFKHRDRVRKESGVIIEGSKLTKSTVERILKNPIYYGMIQYRGEFFLGEHEPIISKELFDTVNKKNVKYGKVSSHSPLKGKVFFEGSQLTVSLIKKKFVYFHKHSEKSGEKIWYNQNEILKYFDENIHLYKMPEKYKEEFLGYTSDLYSDEYKNITTIRKNIGRKKIDLEKEIDGLIRMRSKDEISQDIFVPRKNELMKELETITEQMKNLNTKFNEIADEFSKTVELLTNIDQYWKKWDTLSRLVWIADISVELKIDKEKRLYIEEIPPMKAFREHNLNIWWRYRARRHNLYKFLYKNKESLLQYTKNIEQKKMI